MLKNDQTGSKVKSVITILLLVFLYFLGVVVMWIWTRWSIWLKVIISVPALFFLIAIPVWLFIVRTSLVSGQAMAPNFNNDEYYLTRVVGPNTTISRGDVVVFHAPKASGCPEGTGCDFIARVVGLPGEEIKLDNGFVFINGKRLEEKYLDDNIKTMGGAFLNQTPKVVPTGEYFVLGDNRPFSNDSRTWGFLPVENIISKTLFCYRNCFE